MLILGHAGITLGAVALLNGALIRSGLIPIRENKPREGHQHLSQSPQGQGVSPSRGLSWLTSFGRRIDIRILLVGSLLPDIIDKPVGQFLLRNILNNGRLFCHTLLFLIIITLIGVYLYRTRHRNWLLVLSAGTFAHLIFDEMWLTPETLFWPLYGFAFERGEDLTYWLQGVWYGLFNRPELYIPELIGAMILVWFTAALVRRRRVYSFLTSGQV